jgi:hypothetical protein
MRAAARTSAAAPPLERSPRDNLAHARRLSPNKTAAHRAAGRKCAATTLVVRV